MGIPISSAQVWFRKGEILMAVQNAASCGQAYGGTCRGAVWKTRDANPRWQHLASWDSFANMSGTDSGGILPPPDSKEWRRTDPPFPQRPVLWGVRLVQILYERGLPWLMQQQGLILPLILSYLQYILNAALIWSLSSFSSKNLPNPLRHRIDILIKILNSNLFIPDIC